MKKLVAFLLTLVILVLIVLIVIGITNFKDNEKNGAGTEDNPNNNQITGEVFKENKNTGISGNAIGRGGSSGSSGEAGGSGGSENNPGTTPDRELPSDLNTRPCGFYFLEYDVCAGVCPEGKCLVDGKSCYCRIV